MRKEVKQAVGYPDNSTFIRRCICYAIILAVMLFAAPSIFEKIMVPMAADGIKTAWYVVFVPLALFMMAIGLFRSWRRRWPLAYMNNYNRQAKEDGYEICPRCGAPLVEKRRTRNSREKVGEIVTTTTYNDGSKTVDRKDVHGTVSRTNYYYQCTNKKCALEVDQHISQSHLPWKNKEIRCLVLNDDRLLSRKRSCAKDLLLSRLLTPFLALVIVVVCGVSVYSYANVHDGEWTYLTADKESFRSADDYQNYLLSLDTENPNWHVSYEKEPTDMMSWLFKKDQTVGYSMSGYAGENGDVLEYRFQGYDAGTGLSDGWYTLMQVDGVNVLIDDNNEKIYKQGTDFYDTYAPKLLSLTHDKALDVILERINGGEHALSDMDMEFIRKDNTMVYSYMLSDDVLKINGEFRAITNYPEDQIRETWSFTYDAYEYAPDDLEGYVYEADTP